MKTWGMLLVLMLGCATAGWTQSVLTDPHANPARQCASAVAERVPHTPQFLTGESAQGFGSPEKPPAGFTAHGPGRKSPSGGGDDADDGPEPMVDGTIDLGAIATEFLLLAIDPYPRKQGADLQAVLSEHGIEADAGKINPFAALAALKTKG